MCAHEQGFRRVGCDDRQLFALTFDLDRSGHSRSLTSHPITDQIRKTRFMDCEVETNARRSRAPQVISISLCDERIREARLEGVPA
jgi:hypothetical protein